MTIDSSDAAQAYGRDLLVGEVVRLRAIEEPDVPRLEAWHEDPAMLPLNAGLLRPHPAGSGDRFLREAMADDGPGRAGFAVVDRTDDALVGFVQLRGATLPARAASLAILIRPDRVGRGYGTDAVRVVVGYGFRAMGLHRIELEVFAYNTRARRAYERAGFTTEVVRREALYVNGGFEDEIVMSVLESEWTR